MTNSWWFWWMLLLFVVVITPVGYGWGYRGWGPPYPTYLQRKRHLRHASLGSSNSYNHFAWGWGGDFVWLILFIAAVWFATALWWPFWRYR